MGYENLYEVSSCGRVRISVNQKIRISIPNWAGYHRCGLTKNKKITIFSVHRLVALAFIPNPENYKEVNHIDHNRSNNNIDNLEWCSRSQNAQYSFTRPNRKRAKAWLGKTGSQHPNSSMVWQIKDGKRIASYGSIALAEKDHGRGVGKCVRGERKSAGGFQWERA